MGVLDTDATLLCISRLDSVQLTLLHPGEFYAQCPISDPDGLTGKG
jgi:hypothetical protein